jgi:hypothetical protein
MRSRTRPLARSDGALVTADLFQLFQMGALLAWLTGLLQQARFAWFRKRPIYAVVFLGTGPVFAGIGEIPGLQVSLATVDSWGPLAWVVMLAAAAVFAAVVRWHALHALRRLSRRDRAAYLASRLVVHAFFFALWAVMRLLPVGRAGYEATHLHHFFIGFLLALWGCFNHPLSATLLAIGAGIFVQGISAYHWAWIFYVTPAGSAASATAAGCVTFTGNASDVACSWHAEKKQNDSRWSFIMCPRGYGELQGRPTGSCAVGQPPPAPPAPPAPPLPPWPPVPLAAPAPPPWPPWPPKLL